MSWKIIYLDEVIDISEYKSKDYALSEFIKMLRVEKATPEEKEKFEKSLER